MAIGTTTAILLGVGAAGAGVAASKFGNAIKSVTQSASPIPLPQPPSATDAAAKAEDVIRKKRQSASQSIYTSPLGVAGQADVAKKTLLGQ